LQAILSGLPGDLGRGDRHLPAHAAGVHPEALAERLNKLASAHRERGGRRATRIRSGMALIAPGGHHLLVKRDREGLFIELVPREPSDKSWYRPQTG